MKKGFTLVELIGVVVILGLIALLAFPPLLNAIRENKNKLSDASKEILYSAAQQYVGDFSNSFPKTNGNTFCITLETLTQSEYLPTKVYDSVSGDEIPLTNIVEVKYEQDRFTYNLNNDCVEYIYKGPSLIELLLEQYSEGNSVGLVKDATNPNLYYYTGTNGEVANNFLWYGGHQWRVLEFDTEANTITLITQQPLTAIQPASAVWEDEETYKNSYINQWLNDYFYNSLDSKIQSNIQKTTFNIGIYTDVDEITTEQNVGLLDNDQYTRAGGQNSFLDIKDNFWLGNRYSSSSVRYVHDNGAPDIDSPSYARGVRAVIKISDITITGGDGTLTDSYRTEDKATNTSDVQVGEYINVPYNGIDNACGEDGECTFRVVSKDSNGIKLVLNGLLPTTSKWATDANDNITTSDLIYTNVLNGFIANIDSKYMTTGTYGVGMYENGNSYTVPQATIITANIGLPTVGEMFSGNDIDMAYPASGEKIFVDVTTIENPTVSSWYWTMNRSSSSYVRYVNYNGAPGNFSPSYANGVRAVIYLKSGTSALTFTGGEGTAQSPYTIQ